MKRIMHILFGLIALASCSCQGVIDTLFYDKVETLVVSENQESGCKQFSLNQFIDEMIKYRGWNSREDEWHPGTASAQRLVFIKVDWPNGIRSSEGPIFADVSYSITRQFFMVFGVRPSNDPMVHWMVGVVREELERQGHSENCVTIDVSTTHRAR